MYEGTLYKFKPGLSTNFVERYVQVSQRAFRYYKDQTATKPLVSFRKKIMKNVIWYPVNKESYLKPGAKASANLLEH